MLQLKIPCVATKIELGILAVLSKEKTLNFEYIVRKIIVNYFNENYSIIESFKKYGIFLLGEAQSCGSPKMAQSHRDGHWRWKSVLPQPPKMSDPPHIWPCC